ncbi:MerR family transcriptional regulator [Streptomyces sp. t39]|uniref:MerR family transcriptional regulator n=1 Tax=Streptomyces sp. t39 TaxID=1828156 RepID=UPI0011CE6FBB|nr:MerR family transcriptional regulator [Streptomyces sp. t39]TXS48818.1 MerR family transcriptional regulator [Streptomyces sp. t39]
MKSSGTGADAPMGIGALARRFGLATHVLRHWESKGLLGPERDTAGRRRYGDEDAARVAVILRAKEAGLGLETIRRLVDPADDTRDRREVLRTEAQALRARIAAAQAALDLLDCAIDCPHEDLDTCPTFRRMVTERMTAGGGDVPQVPPRAARAGTRQRSRGFLP